MTVSQNISVTVTTDTADTDEAVENRVKAILTELLAVRRSRKLNELTLSDINHAIRSGYSGATNAAVSEPEADVKLGKVLVTPTWKIEGAVAKVEACNNGFDAVPTWEDITAMVQINRVYNFTNKTKTASKWGVNIRFTITKNEGFEGEVSISGFGGAYE